MVKICLRNVSSLLAGSSLALMLGASGCNALLGIEDVGLACGGGTCDSGVAPIEPGVVGVGGGGSDAPGADLGGSGATSDAGSDNGDIVVDFPPPVVTGSVGGDVAASDAGVDDAGGVVVSPPPGPCSERAAGDVFCEGAARVRCGDGGAVEVSTVCASPEHCQQGSDVLCAVCLEGEARCEGPVLITCNATRTGFDTETCAGPAQCDDTERRCRQAACTPEQGRCRGAQLDRCSQDLTEFVEVATCGSARLCDEQAGRCNVCEPSSARCQGAAAAVTCSADGQTESTTRCGLLQRCDDGVCELGLPQGGR
jgi:hypothetical protein